MAEVEPVPPPKRPRTAFNFFSDAVRPGTKERNPHLDQKVCPRTGMNPAAQPWVMDMGHAWVAWVAGLAALDMCCTFATCWCRPPACLPAWLTPLLPSCRHPGPCQKHCCKSLTACLWPNMQGISKMVGEMWAQLSAEEKRQYNAAAQRDRQRYELELRAYQARARQVRTQWWQPCRACLWAGWRNLARASQLPVQQWRKARRLQVLCRCRSTLLSAI